MVIWAFIRVPPSNGLSAEHATITGTQFSWSWLSALNSVLGAYATLSVNIPDFTRYAKNEKAQFVQPLIIPVAFILSSFAGIAVTSAGIQLYGKVLWNPLLLIDNWENRTAAFFASLPFLLATIASNISANTFGAGNDMTALLPKYINIRRGQIICAFIGGWAFIPWKILANAQGFLNFMSGYTIFLGPFAGIMITDFWLVHKGKVDVPAMYDPSGRYRYIGGFNWRAVLAMLVTVGPTFPGLIESINLAVSFVVASTVYYVSSILFPARETFVEKLILADDAGLDHVRDGNFPMETHNGKGDDAKVPGEGQ
ncbi:putative permease [Boletus reticuloceps]|uniref:Putative permease n=1 Tax=Boletus reticuloceps TaxID=495285 RepID=A0A8I3A8N1_9AGAM|nr:hypothetical protein JVT61DRAFT_11131 [Boletus reticuloceps]KAG6374031.1 putative permease [Boletus reticuloceps]